MIEAISLEQASKATEGLEKTYPNAHSIATASE